MISDREIPIRQLFPPGDPEAEWVYSLTALSEDLVSITRALRPALEEQRLRDTLFFARQQFVRIFEARRLIESVRNRPELERYLNQECNPGALLERVYSAGDSGQSQVERIYGRFRHQSVHLMWPGSDELAEALRNAGFLPARIWRTEKELSYQWAQAVSGMQLFGDRSDPNWMKGFSDMNALAGQIAGAWIMLSGMSLASYARERDIDLNQLLVSEE